MTAIEDHRSATGEHGAGGATALLPVGTRVEVRSGFDRTWSKGFRVAGHLPGGYHVERLSDGSILPATFTAADVRRERKREVWWV